MATRSSDFRRGTLAGMGVIFAAQALYWFLSGGPTTATAARAWAVVGQAVVGLVTAGWAWRRSAPAPRG